MNRFVQVGLLILLVSILFGASYYIFAMDKPKNIEMDLYDNIYYTEDTYTPQNRFFIDYDFQSDPKFLIDYDFQGDPDFLIDYENKEYSNII